MKLFPPVSGFQSDLNKLSEWCERNSLFFNVDKCKTLTFSRTLYPVEFAYMLAGTVLDRVSSINDLGVIMNEKMNFSEHVNVMVGKAFAMLGFIRRPSFEFRDPYTLKSLYTSLVRPKLEYASCVWNPFYDVHVDKIERVQKWFIHSKKSRVDSTRTAVGFVCRSACRIDQHASVSNQHACVSNQHAFVTHAVRVESTRDFLLCMICSAWFGLDALWMIKPAEKQLIP
jgi:hypothetical protein